jgi:hypothetical protein
MPNQRSSDSELTPEAVEVLKDIEAETEKLRAVDPGFTPPANRFDPE